MASKKKADYERIEPDWIAGIKSPQQMADEYEADTGIKISRVAIIRHFDKKGISRDLSRKIHDKADSIVKAAMVTGKVTGKVTPNTPHPKESEIVTINAENEAHVQITQRKDIQRYRNLVIVMLSELEETTDNKELFGQLGEIMSSGDADAAGKMDAIYRRVISMPSRIDSVKKLAETLKILIALEREAFGIGEDKKQVDESIRDFLKSCRGKSLPIV